MWIRISVIFMGAALAFHGVQEIRLASKASDEPASLTCAELIADGPGDNLHVTLGEFIAPDAFVFENATGKPGRHYDVVYIPLLPVDGEWHQTLQDAMDEEGNIVGDVPPPRNIRVIAKLKNIRNDEALYRELDRGRAQGMVINDIDSLDSDHKRLLAESYPNIDVDACWILEVGRRPGGYGMIGFFVGVGALLVVLGCVLPVGRSHRSPQTKSPDPPEESEPASEAPPAEADPKTDAPADDDKNPYARSD